MFKVDAINLKDEQPMLVSWDLGRRCNYDCTYCGSSRHNNTSPHATLTDLKNTLQFINNYTAIYDQKRSKAVKTVIDFTGGEPTTNPDFWNFIKYIKENSNYRVGLTTNGTWPEYRIEDIVNYVDGITISWHAEADESLKTRVVENIKKIKEHNIWFQVNVMLHCDYFEEAKEICAMLKELDIKYNPVPIGDGNIEISGWFEDEDGSMRRTSHTYTEEQQEWFWNEVGVSKKPKTTAEGTAIGRKCCGGRCIEGLENGEWKLATLVDNRFKNWQCSVNWFFLHIDQETGEVYHHQTCQALFNGQRGSLGNIKNSDKIISELTSRFSNNNIPAIVCPNDRCGCGMCVPKAKYNSDFKEIFSNISKVDLDQIIHHVSI